MGNKNNRGQAPAVRAAHQAQELAQQKTLARQQAFDFDYTTFPKHSALSIKKNLAAGEVTLLINLDIFNIEEFHFVVSLNKAYNFQQMKLAAAAFGLNFKDWTMATKVRGVAGTWNVDVESEWDRKLARIYKQDSLAFKVKSVKSEN
ncbi:hypothetical protein BCON_0595g00030 [Botryotinia convoluta]|uniref:Uncharacterized protein n=1 Tax=Botryotinia convoluta TaxID=54673 RepID=A0A4Z1H9I4_9HELO|nr:hypothetical protein BCON_0595g00030 [Botryotinia convoluta]